MIALAITLGCSLAIGLISILAPWMWKRTVPKRKKEHWIPLQLTRANLPKTTAVRLGLTSAVAGAVGGAVALILTGIPVVGLIAAFLAAGIPMFWVLRRAQRRHAFAAARWPDAIDHVVGSIRAGLGLPDALCSLAEAGPRELQPQFLVFAREYRRTGAWDFALNALTDRCADPVADRFIELLRLSREVGGIRLVSVLQSFNEFLREDASTRAEMQARQSWITNAARLGVAAPWIVLLMLSMRPEARAAYNSLGGVALIAGGAVCCTLAYALMASFARFKSEPRWSK